MVGWTVATRSKKQRKRVVQIFVKVDGMKTVLRELSPEDKVQKILNTVSGSDQDVYTMCEGMMLRKDDQLKSRGVRDGRKIQIMSRMRSGGRHKDKRSKAKKKRATNPERPEQKSDEGPATMDKDEVLRRPEENEGYQKIIDCMSEGSEGEVEQNAQSYLAKIKLSWMNKEQLEYLEGGVRRAVAARRNGRGEEQEQRRQDAAGRARAERRTGTKRARQESAFRRRRTVRETRAEIPDEPEVTGKSAEVRTGRGSSGLV